MRMIVAALALSLLAGSALAAPPPREVVGHVADKIAAGYFDAAKGAEIARDLKAEAAKGAYDRYADPLDLAQALTTRLRPLDAHFQVSYAAAPPRAAGPAPGPQAAPRVDDDEAERRQNYGFRSVEVLPGNIGLIDMRFFADFRGPDDPARAAADAAMAVIARTDAVIIDLRDNGGGSPAMVGYLAAHFAPPGADIYNTFKSREEADTKETPPVEPKGPRRVGTPLYILTSARTGSAAESLAYTLQTAKLATIVGDASGGAANPGGMVPAGDGFSVFVSAGRPVNPITKTNWEGVGVKPDAATAPADALARAQQLALAKLVQGPQSELAATEHRWALEALAPAATVALADYAGSYGVREVAVDGGRVLVSQGRRPKQSLRPLGGDLFALEGASVPIRVKFDRDAAGKISGMTQMFPDGRLVRFARTG